MSQYETYRAGGCLPMLGLVGILLIGMGATIGAIAMLPRDVHGGLAVGVMMGVGLLTAATAILFGISASRRSKHSAQRALTAEGFTFMAELNDTQRQQLLSGVGRLARVRENPTDLNWAAIKELPAGQAVVFHHSFTTGSGKTAQLHTKVVVALPVRRQTQIVYAFRTNFLERRRDAKQGVQDILLGDARFDKAFGVQCVDPALAKRLLSERVRELMMSGPRRESWVLAHSHVLCVFGEEASARSLGVMIRRTQCMIDLLARAGV